MLVSEIERTPLRLQVARELRRLLRSGFYPIGSRVTEKSVAEALNVSKTPAREALSLLGENGVLRSLPNGGYVVPLLTGTEIDDLYQTREFLELPALRLAIEDQRPQTRSDLAASLQDLTRQSKRPEVHDFIEAFLQFREILFRDCENRFLISLIHRIDNQTEAMKVHIFASPELRQKSIDQYSQLSAAFCDGDVASAERILREHHATGLSAYHVVVAEYSA